MLAMITALFHSYTKKCPAGARNPTSTVRMVSRRSISTARWAAAILSGIGSLSIFFILWRPFFSIEHDDATMAYGIISITWTIAAALVLLGGFYVGSLLQWHVSALAARQFS